MRVKTMAFAVVAVALMLISPLATESSGADSAATKDTAPIPAPKEYLYDLWTDDDNVTIKSVSASIDGSNLETITGKRTSKGPISGLWDFNAETGMGPFNSFYAAINISEGSGEDNGETMRNFMTGTIAFVLDPYDLSKTLKGTVLTGTYNIMLVIPTVYWKADSNHLYISSSPSYDAGGVSVSGMVAYAHSLGDGKTFTNAFPYIGIGVYEATVADNKLLSVSGSVPTGGKTGNEFKAYADALDPADGADYQLWNFYQWTLYKIMAYTVMGTKNSQEMLGNGPVNWDGNFYSTSHALKTGLADAAGPYAQSTYDYSKLFIENPWGSLLEFVGDAAFNDRVLCTGNSLGGEELGNQTSDKLSLPENGWISGTDGNSAYWDLPVSTQSDSNSKNFGVPGDRIRTNASWRSLRVGGSWFHSTYCGIAYLDSNDAISSSYPDGGTRLAYVMSPEALLNVAEVDGMLFSIVDDEATLIGYKGSPKELEIPKSVNGSDVASIANGALSGCASLESVTIPDSVKSISSNAFDGCPIKSLTLAVESVGAAFSGIETLETLKLLGTVSSVEDGAFAGCSALSSISILNPVMAVGENSFPAGLYDGDTPVSGDISGDYYKDTEGRYNRALYTVTFAAQPKGYGSVSLTELTVRYGTAIEADGSSLAIGDTTVTATPAESDAQYVYRFVGWEFPESGAAAAVIRGAPTYTVTGDTAVIASFGADAREYTVTVTKSGASYGTVSKSSFTVPYGAKVSADGNVLTVGQEQCMAEAKAPTAKYVYSFKGWTIPSDTVAGDMTVKAGFARKAAE
ncbi:MAG: leucine-rich repeat protein, partial [Candidatus Methanomethylophilaceae archaeon]|nr:leucine-rich repeat protein [Candidatus Methanomethylophilaceae archaeon]